MSVDPLSGTGLANALMTGEAAGLALAHLLVGHSEPVDRYERWLDARFADYRQERREVYGRETRWPLSPFWRRRLQPTAA